MSVPEQFIPWVEEIVAGQVGVGLAYRMLGDINRAEDVVQTALVKLVGPNIDWSRFETEKHCQNYFKRIVYNLAVETGRRSRFSEDIDADREPTSHEPDPVAFYIANEQCELVRHCLAELPDAQRIVLELQCDCDLTFEEIAYELEIPLGTALRRAHTARERLRKMMLERNFDAADVVYGVPPHWSPTTEVDDDARAV